MTLMAYDHVQRGIFHRVLLVLGLGLVGWSLLAGDPAVGVLLVAVGLVLVLAAASFAWLRVRDAGEHLLVQFGPLPLFRRRVRYDEIEGVETGRSTVIDGWGIHVVPGRGPIWNIHGFDVVRLRLRGGRRLRIGTDDPHGLAAWIEARTGGGEA